MTSTLKKVTELYANQESVIEVSELDKIPGIKEYIAINDEIYIPYETLEKILCWPEGSFSKKVRYIKFHEFLELNDIKIFKLKNIGRGNVKGTRVFKAIKKTHLRLLIDWQLTEGTKNDEFLDSIVDAYHAKFK
ncbi:MAG: hypothetical protein F6K34_01445 [Okeania sp. SIO4D6]|nr:hypothetical protein [Okeania sp. SIO4D6]